MPISKHTTRRAPQMERYVEIKPVRVDGLPDAHNVFLTVGHQGFFIGHGFDTKEEAEWMRDMLCIALAKVVSDNRS